MNITVKVVAKPRPMNLYFYLAKKATSRQRCPKRVRTRYLLLAVIYYYESDVYMFVLVLFHDNRRKGESMWWPRMNQDIGWKIV